MDRYFSPGKRLTPKTRRKISVFSVCLLISVILWLFFYLSNQYRYRVSTYVVFINQPAEKAVSIRDSVKAELTVQSTGWSYFFRRLNPDTLITDLSELADEEAVDLRDFLDSYNLQTAAESQEIVDITPDTVYFDLVARIEKKVPVLLDTQITYQHQYINYAPITISPDSVTVSGPVKEVRPINAIRTVRLKLDNIHSTVNQLVALDRENRKNIHLDSNAVMLTIPVEEYTENTLKIPVEVTNNKDQFEVTLVPSMVSITYYVPMSRYTEVRPEDFKVTVDLNEWQNNNKSVLNARLERAPDFVKIVRTSPDNIDFLVYK